MLTNEIEVLQLTGKTVTNQHIQVAQGIVEAYVGRTEDEIINPDDKVLMSRAVAYQTVYMVNNSDKVFEQVAIVQQSQMDGSVTLDRDLAAPFVAPLAALALRNVSWRKSRSVKTGPIFGRTFMVRWERD